MDRNNKNPLLELVLKSGLINPYYGNKIPMLLDDELIPH